MISPAVSSSFKERLTVIELRDRTAARAVTGKQTNRIYVLIPGKEDAALA